jgi:hypothetical protein
LSANTRLLTPISRPSSASSSQISLYTNPISPSSSTSTAKPSSSPGSSFIRPSSPVQPSNIKLATSLEITPSLKPTRLPSLTSENIKKKRSFD